MQTTVDLIRTQATGEPNWFNLENNVNAAWNAIFFDPVIFPVNAKVLVHPEAYPRPDNTTGLRNDLLVTRLAQNNLLNTFQETAILYYEGKGGGSADSWEKIRTQLQEFIQAAVGTRQAATGWGIGTKGTAVRFWRYQRLSRGFGMADGTGECMVPLFVNNNNVVVDNNNNAGSLAYGLYNLNNGQHWADILLILREMATQNPRPQGNP